MGKHFLRENDPMCRALSLRCLQTIVFSAAALLMVAGMCVGNLQAQDARPIPAPSITPRGIPQDWSNRHVVYTRNGSFEEMVKVRDDPRFINSVRRWNMQEHTNQAKVAGATGLIKRKNSKVDWSVNLGHFAGMAIGETPAKYTFNPIAPPSCSDFVVFTINAGTHVAVGTQANLVGITNLYSGSSPTGICGTHPTFLFSYAIGSNGSGLSPVISVNGSKVAWVETPLSGSNANAILHVTTWAAGQGTNATVTSVGIGSGSSDIALDYTNFTVSGTSCPATTSSTNTNSDLYVDYANDAGYIGADNGILYHISGIFGGTPTVDFCIATGSFTGLLGAAVYDAANSEVYISDPSSVYAYTVGASSFTSAGSYQYGANGSIVTSGPLLDSFNGFVYMFSAEDAATGHTSMTQLPTSLASALVVVPLGPATTSAYPVLFNGDFDNNYLTNGPAVSGSTLYTCGTDSTNTAAQDLYAIGFHPGTGVAMFNPVMKANTNVNPGGGNGICSPITEFYDGATDRIFVGMGDVGATDGANVVTMWDVTTQLTDGVPLSLSAVAPSGADAVYTGTITGGGANAFAGLQFVVTGFTGPAAVDNGTYICTQSTATTLTLANATAVAVTAPGTAVAQTTPTASSAADYFGGTTGFAIDNNAIGTTQAESIYFSTLAPIPAGDTFRCFANHFCAVKLTQSLLQ
jgi:hypothetical protein